MKIMINQVPKVRSRK